MRLRHNLNPENVSLPTEEAPSPAGGARSKEPRTQSSKPNGRKVKVPGRPDLLGEMYEVDSHKQVPPGIKARRIIIIMVSREKEKMAEVLNYALNATIPADPKAADKNGALVLSNDLNFLMFRRIFDS